MLIVHNAFLRQINAIFLQGANIEKRGTPQDTRDFAGYIEQFCSTIEEHHGVEEKFVFPAVEEFAGVPGIMSGNVNQHHAFEAGLHAFRAYAKAVFDGKETYAWTKLHELIDAFMPALRQHLAEEIETLKSLDEIDKPWEDFFKKLSEEILKKANDPDIKVCWASLTWNDLCTDTGWANRSGPSQTC